MKGFVCGTAVALVTPFYKKEINEERLKQLIARQIQSGTDALLLLGTTSEPASLTEKEKRKIMQISRSARDEFSPKNVDGTPLVKLIFGCGSNDTKTARNNARIAEEHGADGLLAVTPYYNKCTQNGLYYHFRAIAEAVRIPLIVYSVPSRTGMSISPRAMRKLSEIPNVAGIKDAGGDMKTTLEILRLVREKCDVFSGEDALNFPVLAAGGAGVISAVANLTPRLIKAQYLAVKNSDLKKAAQITDMLTPLVSACFCAVNPIPIKAAMKFVGFPCGSPRAPLTPLCGYREKQIGKIIDALKAQTKEAGLTDGENL